MPSMSMFGPVGRTLVPGADSPVEELAVPGDGIGPEHTFHVDDEAVHRELVNRVGEVVLLEGCGDARIAGGLIVGLDCAEEYRPGPGHGACLGAETAFRAVGCGYALLAGAALRLLGGTLLRPGVCRHLGVEVLGLALRPLGVLSALASGLGRTLALSGLLLRPLAVLPALRLSALSAAAAESLLRRVRRRAFLCREGMVQDIVYVLLPDVQELPVIEQESQAGEAVEVVGGLLEAPPVGSAGFGVPLQLACP